MSGIRASKALAITVLLLVATGLAAQQYEGVYDAVSPAPSRGPLRLFVTQDDSGYRFLMAGGNDFLFECTSTEPDEYECAGEIDFTARFEDGREELVVITDAFGPDVGQIRAPLYASGDAVAVTEFRGVVDEDWAYLQAFTTQTTDGLAMRWFFGEIFLETTMTLSASGTLVGEADGVAFSLAVEGDRAVFSAGGSGLPDTIYARVLPSRADEPVRTADVGPRFDDYSVDGDLESAFEAWHATPFPASARVSARELGVVSRVEIDGGGRRLSHLSPPGDLLISHAPSSAEVVVLESATGAEVVSFELDYELAGPPFFAWSPDGSRIAEASDGGLFRPDSGDRVHIALLSLTDGTVTDLTADESVSPDSIESDPRKIDLAPTWVGSRRLVFERRSERDVILAELDLETRVVTKGADLPAEPMYPIASAFSFVPMSGELFADFEAAWNRDDGIRVIGPLERRVSMELEISYPLSVELTAASFDGRDLLLMPTDLTQGLPESEDPPLLYDRDEDELLPLLPGAPGARQILGAAFSPDGSKVVYLFRDHQTERDVLAVRNVDDLTSERVLVTEVPGYPNESLVFTGNPGLAWGANDRVMLPLDRHQRAIVLTLGQMRE